MVEEITFSKTKLNGTTVKKQVPVFRQGTWKEWLQWLLRLQEYSAFMRYTHEHDDQLAFVEDIQLLLFDEDLHFFNDFVREEVQLRPDVAVAGLRHLTARHCPAGTRGMLMDELTQLKKVRSNTVRQYSSEFRMLLRMIPFLEHGENEPVVEADAVRMYRFGMPIDWQVEINRIARIWDLASIETQFELIERNEHDEAILRGNRSRRSDPKKQRGNERNEKPARQQQQHPQAAPRNQGNGNRGGSSGSRYCSFCKKDNHNDDHCFRNPKSPAYRPRNGGSQRGDGPNAMAAMQEQLADMAAMVTSMKKRQDEEYAAMRFYEDRDVNTMAAMSEKTNDPRMEVQISVGTVKVTALLDTGCTRSAIDRKTTETIKPDIVLRREMAKFRKADGSLGRTTHCATTTFKLLDFSHSRKCSHEFRVAETLLYPIILGRDFMQQQKMVLDFDR
ncbi:hypothetical protein PHMEG_00033451, partial [Phytophthora megakarya]